MEIGASLSNELIFALSMLFQLAMTLVFFRFFGRSGLYVCIAMNIILCNIEVPKLVMIFGMEATLGNVLYAGIFLATDMLSEFYGKRSANKGVLLGFVVAILMAIYLQIALAYRPSPNDAVQPHMKALFGLVPGIVISSLLAYLASQFADVHLYHKILGRTGRRHLWLRNNASTLVSQLIDTAVFTASAVLLGVFPLASAFSIFLTAYLLKCVVAVCDTPFIYLAHLIAPKRSGE